jgi:hypothetical protein
MRNDKILAGSNRNALTQYNSSYYSFLDDQQNTYSRLIGICVVSSPLYGQHGAAHDTPSVTDTPDPETSE